MKTYDEISKDEIRELLNANWITHDAMWFSNSVKINGVIDTNEINKKAARMMAKIEAKRLKEVLDTGNPKSFQELKLFLLTSFEIIRGSFMKFELMFQDSGIFIMNVPQCFAYIGVKRLGVIDHYDCGIVERILGWFDELEVSYRLQPDFGGCLKHSTGQCAFQFEITFTD